MAQLQAKHNVSTTLPENVNDALRFLVRLTKKLVDLTDQETQCLVMQDHVRFAYLQRDKEKIAEDYMQASAEFHTRLEEFRRGDKSLLMKLDALQKELKQKSEENHASIKQLKDRAQKNTTSTLFTVQEMGQRVHFPDQTQSEEGRAQ